MRTPLASALHESEDGAPDCRAVARGGTYAHVLSALVVVDARFRVLWSGQPRRFQRHAVCRRSGTTGDGAGDAHANVQLIRHPDALQAIGDAFAIVGTVGLACIAGNDSLCHPYAQATAAPDGSYTFGPIRGADTQGSTGEALLFSAWLSGPPPSAPATAPAGVDADFYIQKTQVTVPPLRLWETAGVEDDTSGAPSFSWPSLESSIGSAADDYRLQITTAKGQIIWSATTSGSSTQVSIDPRVTQDFAGNWATWAHRRIAGDGTDFDLTWYSPSMAYATQGRIPLSRGKDCWLQGASGPVKQSPCPLTDGDLATSLQPLPAPQCPSGQTCTPPQQNNWVYVDLGAATTGERAGPLRCRLRLVVVCRWWRARSTAPPGHRWRRRSRISSTSS